MVSGISTSNQIHQDNYFEKGLTMSSSDRNDLTSRPCEFDSDDQLSLLSDSVLLKIISYLSTKIFKVLSRVNKRLNAFCKDTYTRG